MAKADRNLSKRTREASQGKGCGFRNTFRKEKGISPTHAHTHTGG